MDPIAMAGSALSVLNAVKNQIKQLENVKEEVEDFKKQIELFEVTLLMVPSRPVEVKKDPKLSVVVRKDPEDNPDDTMSPGEKMRQMKGAHDSHGFRVHTELDVMFTGMEFIIDAAVKTIQEAGEILVKLNDFPKPKGVGGLLSQMLGEVKGVFTSTMGIKSEGDFFSAYEGLNKKKEMLTKSTSSLQNAIGVASYAVQLEQLESALDATQALVDFPDMKLLWKKKIGSDSTKTTMHLFCEAYLGQYLSDINKSREMYCLTESIGRSLEENIALARYMGELYNGKGEAELTVFELAQQLKSNNFDAAMSACDYANQYLALREREFLSKIRFDFVDLSQKDENNTYPLCLQMLECTNVEPIQKVKPFHRALIVAEIPISDNEDLYIYDHLVMLKHEKDLKPPYLRPYVLSESKFSQCFLSVKQNMQIVSTKPEFWNGPKAVQYFSGKKSKIKSSKEELETSDTQDKILQFDGQSNWYISEPNVQLISNPRANSKAGLKIRLKKIFYTPMLFHPGFYSPRYVLNEYMDDEMNSRKMSRSAKSYYRGNLQNILNDREKLQIRAIHLQLQQYSGKLEEKILSATAEKILTAVRDTCEREGVLDQLYGESVFESSHSTTNTHNYIKTVQLIDSTIKRSGQKIKLGEKAEKIKLSVERIMSKLVKSSSLEENVNNIIEMITQILNSTISGREEEWIKSLHEGLEMAKNENMKNETIRKRVVDEISEIEKIMTSVDTSDVEAVLKVISDAIEVAKENSVKENSVKDINLVANIGPIVEVDDTEPIMVWAELEYRKEKGQSVYTKTNYWRPIYEPEFPFNPKLLNIIDKEPGNSADENKYTDQLSVFIHVPSKSISVNAPQQSKSSSLFSVHLKRIMLPEGNTSDLLADFQKAAQDNGNVITLNTWKRNSSDPESVLHLDLSDPKSVVFRDEDTKERMPLKYTDDSTIYMLKLEFGDHSDSWTRTELFLKTVKNVKVVGVGYDEDGEDNRDKERPINQEGEEVKRRKEHTKKLKDDKDISSSATPEWFASHFEFWKCLEKITEDEKNINKPTDTEIDNEEENSTPTLLEAPTPSPTEILNKSSTVGMLVNINDAQKSHEDNHTDAKAAEAIKAAEDNEAQRFASLAARVVVETLQVKEHSKQIADLKENIDNLRAEKENISKKLSFEVTGSEYSEITDHSMLWGNNSGNKNHEKCIKLLQELHEFKKNPKSLINYQIRNLHDNQIYVVRAVLPGQKWGKYTKYLVENKQSYLTEMFLKRTKNSKNSKALSFVPLRKLSSESEIGGLVKIQYLSPQWEYF